MKNPLMIIMLVLALSASIQAAVPNTMNYQGRLTDVQGQPVTSTVSMTFTIYDAETNGNSKWSEIHPSVSVVAGLFSVVLGQGTPAVPIEDTVFTSPDRWLEIAVGGETIIPRTKLASSPYSLQAGWTLVDDVLYTSDEYGIAGESNTCLGTATFSHVNLGISNKTGEDSEYVRFCTVSGGFANTASGYSSTISGGSQNKAKGSNSTVSGGVLNYAWNYGSTVGGGQYDSSTGFCSTVPGGYNCKANGKFSFAAGYRAKALHHGSFVWADTTYEDFESTGPNQFLIRSSGGVGIGSDTPLGALHVRRRADNGVALFLSGASKDITWFPDEDLQIGQWDGSTFTERMRILSDGNVGIGTTNPEDIFHVSAGSPSVIVDATDEADAKLLFRDADGPSNQTFEIAFNAADQDLHIRSDDNSGADIVTVTHGGLIGIKETNPSVSLHVNGSICYTGSIGACSDERYKKDVTPIAGAIDKLDRLRGVSFNWRQDEYHDQEFNDKPQLGLIAQEVKEVFPELVMQDNEGYYSVDYVKLTPVLVEAVKELKAENDALKAKMSHLTSLVESILAQQVGDNDDGAAIAGEISK